MSKEAWIPRLSDPEEAAEHLALSIDRRDLGAATVLLVCCDALAHPVANLHVVNCDLQASPTDNAAVLDMLLDRLAHAGHPAPSGLVLGLTRRGGEQVQPYDRAWFRAFYRLCHRRGLVPHGVYVVGRGGARAVHIDDAA